MATETHRTVEAVWKIESARVIAAVARMTGDVALAEDLAQEVFVAALEQWPQSGIPDNPGAWLTAAAKHHAVDHFRHTSLLQSKHQQLSHEMDRREQQLPDPVAALDDDIGDELLSLIFTACHPILSPESRVALTLRLLGGLSTDEIARAFLISTTAAAQRITRAKRSLADARVPFEVPQKADFAPRLASVLQVVYLIFNEGYTATSGDRWLRPELCDEALRLGRILAELLPGEPEIHGLMALMELQSSRNRARLTESGEPILLLEQNRALWDPLLVRRGLSALRRAETLSPEPGPYTLQAAIAACHAHAVTAAETDWPRIAALYELLANIAPSPVVELNQAVAIAMASGPQAGLEKLDTIAAEPALRANHLLPAIRADLLAKLGRHCEACAELERAASLTENQRERDLLRQRIARELSSRAGPS